MGMGYFFAVKLGICDRKLLCSIGIWFQKVLSDMKGKATGNQTLADAKVFLYSAVSWSAAGTGLDYCTALISNS